MALTQAYLVTTKNLSAIINSVVNAKAPERFTNKFLENLNFKSSNDRLYVGVFNCWFIAVPLLFFVIYCCFIVVPLLFLCYFAACMPMMIVGLLSAIAQAKAAVAGVGIVAKNPEQSGKAIIFAAMVETYAVLALLISILAIFNVDTVISFFMGA